LEAPGAETCSKSETLPKSEWLFVIREWLFVIDSGSFGVSSPEKSQITNNQSQIANFVSPDRMRAKIIQSVRPGGLNKITVR